MARRARLTITSQAESIMSTDKIQLTNQESTNTNITITNNTDFSFLTSQDTLANLDLLLATTEPDVQDWELSKLLSNLILAVLRDGLTALQILHTTHQLPPGVVHSDWLGSKTLVEMLEGGVFMDVIQTHVKTRIEIDEEKIENDRALLEIILVRTIEQLERGCSFTELVKTVENLLKKADDVDILLGSVVSDEKKMMQLRRMKEKTKLKYEQRIQDLIQDIGRLKDEHMHLVFETEEKIKYLIKWEDARQEQNKLLLESKEKGLEKNADDMVAEINKEQTVHTEIINYFSEVITDYENEIERWMRKYDLDMDEKEIHLQTMKAVLDNQHEQLELLQYTFKYRQQEIDDYLVVRERRREERAELYRRNEAATKIQAWWRAIMISRGLGPYKKKRKGKKGDKGKKGSAAAGKKKK